MAKVARARYLLEASWSTHAKGAFVIGTSLIGGTHKLGVSVFDFVFSGEFDDMSEMMRSAVVTRGRDDQRAFVVAGQMTVTVFDEAGLLNVENASSPLATFLVDRYQPIRLGAYLPAAPTTREGLYYGFIEKIDWKPYRRKAGAGIATLTCKDLLLWLAEARPIIASTGSTTTGAAIGKVLDSIGWVEPSARSLAVGDTIPDFSADASKTALQLIEDLLEAERGLFFVNGDGVATFQDRLSRSTATSSGTISKEMRSLETGVDRSRLRNRVRVKRAQSGYVAIATDATSKSLIGDRDLEEIETAYLQSNTQADGLAGYILSQRKTSVPPMRDLQLDNRTTALLTQIVQRELGHVVTIDAPGAGIASPLYMIESIEQRVDARAQSHEATWLLSEHDLLAPFRIGTSKLAPTSPEHVFVY